MYIYISVYISHQESRLLYVDRHFCTLMVVKIVRVVMGSTVAMVGMVVLIVKVEVVVM